MKQSYCVRLPADLKLLAAMRAKEMDLTFSDFITLAVRKMIMEDYTNGRSGAIRGEILQACKESKSEITQS